MKAIVFNILILSACFSASLILADSNPNLASQVDSIISGLDQIQSSLTNDISLYVTLEKNLSDSASNFDQRDAERQKLITAVHDKINHLNSLIAQEKADSLNLSQQKDAVIASLQKNLSDLQAQTTQEITQLNQKITQLTTDLTDAQQSYTNLSTLDTQKVSDVVSKLTSAQDSYSKMADARTSFLAALDKLAARINTHLAADKQDIVGLGTELAGPNFLTGLQETAAPVAPATPAAGK